MTLTIRWRWSAAAPDWPRPAAREAGASGCWFWNGTRNRAAFESVHSQRLWTALFQGGADWPWYADVLFSGLELMGVRSWMVLCGGGSHGSCGQLPGRTAEIQADAVVLAMGCRAYPWAIAIPGDRPAEFLQ